MSVLWPLPGSPEGIVALAAALDASAARVEALGSVAAGLTRGATWDGPAGESFAERLARLTPVLQRVGHRYAAAAAELRRLASALEAAQQLATAALRRHDDALAGIARVEGLITAAVAAGALDGSAELERLLAEQRRHVGQQLAAEADHRRALADWEDADGRCAVALATIADDAISDPTAYRFLHGARSIGAAVSTLGLDGLPGAGLLAGIAVRRVPGVGLVTTAADWVSKAADVGLLVHYGEGDWGELAAGVGIGVLGFAGTSLRRGSTAGSVKGDDGRFVNVTPHSTRDRVRLGTKAEIGARQRALQDTLALRLPPSPSRPALTGTRAQKVRELILRRANERYLDDLRLAKAGGAVRMYTAGVTLEVASKAPTPALEDKPSPEEPTREETPPREESR